MIPVAAVFTVAIGAWGWMVHGSDIADALYKALALFGFQVSVLIVSMLVLGGMGNLGGVVVGDEGAHAHRLLG